MPDIATLGIKIENGQVERAVTSLDKMTVAGGKTEAAIGRVSRRMGLAEIEARKMDAALSASSLSIKSMALSMGLTESAAGKLSHAMGALGVVAALGFIGRKTIEETEAAQNAMAQLEAAVQSTGGVAGRTVAQLDEMSMALQRQTAFSDEAVKGAQAMLLTFDKIRGLEFDRATVAVTDLAARMGGDLQGAAIQVGKALQDPTTGLTALRRSGVSFSESQIVLIKSLYDAGQAAEGQRVILKELEHQFGGSAAAARDTLGGALAGLKNAWGDLFEVSQKSSRGMIDGINGITDALPVASTALGKFVEYYGFLATTMATVAGIADNIAHGNAGLNESLINSWKQQWKELTGTAPADPTYKHRPTGAGVRAGDEETAAAKQRRSANEDMVREAKQAIEIAALEGRAQDIARISYEETNKVIKAQRELKGALLDETLKAIHTEADYRRKAANVSADVKYAKDMQEIWRKGVSDVIQATQDGIASMLSSIGKLFSDMLVRMQKEGQTNTRLEMGLAAVSGGVAGYNTGQSLYSSSHGAAGNYSRGALGGAASGAMAGAALGSIVPGIGTAVGAIVGGAAGFVGGVLGMASASKEAAKQMAEAQKAISLSMAALRADVNHDVLASGIAAIEADREQRRRAIEDAYSGGGAGSEQVRKRGVALAEMNALEDERIRQLREEIAVVRQRYAEDLQVRLLTAQGHTDEADALRLQLAQQREMQDAIKNGADPATLALLDQVQAQEKLTAATNQANSAALNMVQGYKLQAAIFAGATGRGLQQIIAPGTPLPDQPGFPIRPGAQSSGDLTLNLIMPNGDVLGKVVMKDFKRRKGIGDSELAAVLN